MQKDTTKENLLASDKELRSEITPEEYGMMVYNVNKLSAKDTVLDYFPKLNAVKELKIKLDPSYSKDKVLRYIILAYDKNSPYRRRIRDMHKRKQLCAIAAGFTIRNGDFEDYVKAMLLNLIPAINVMIVEYVRSLREHKFSYLIALEQMYYSDLAKIFDGEKVKIDELEKTEAKLEQIVEDLLADDKDKGLAKDIFDISVYKEINLRPEAIAELLGRGERFIASRYA